ncbi:sentrin-specific protease 6 [Hippocampus zosterae]|uniref:sentrin-specific protease 6 n=1 Tax=Hippocampus zosterae TaxID=109293 RepID=UPI00223E617A|nr:sentrin-specific protease 6 [Hippocampus zosterae]
MAHNAGQFLHALERSEAGGDGGYKHKWSFPSGAGGKDEDEHYSGVMTAQETERQASVASDGNESPSFRHFTSADPLRTYEKRPSNVGRHKRLSLVPSSIAVSDYFIVSPAPSQRLVLQGRHFQHAHVTSALGKPDQRNGSSGGTRQATEVDNVVLTCADEPDAESADPKGPVQQKRKALETAPVYQTACGKCREPCEDASECRHCGNSPACLPRQRAPSLLPPLPRAPLRSQPCSFYKGSPGGGGGGPARADAPPPADLAGANGRSPPPASASCCYATRKSPRGRRAPAAQQRELDHPIVLSSDDEANDGSAASAGRLDGGSPQPADSAHSSPAPCGGRVEAAVKSGGEPDDPSADFFDDVNMKFVIPRRSRMKDQFGKQPSSPRSKRSKVEPGKCASIILQCRSVRVGTLRRMVTKPVVFSVEHILLETEGPEPNTVEKVCLRASELISCEWCSVRKLPVLFFQTTPDECVRLRAQLNMTRRCAGQWYDCAGQQSDEKYVVLIFVDGLDMKEQMILEDILSEIGQSNNLDNFPAKLPFDEANTRLVNFNKATKQKQDKLKGIQATSRRSPPTGTLDAAAFFDREQQDVADLQPTFSGPVVKLMVYPPPPAKGGILVTNEDLHCLNDGEFLNDVIIDFYLKYLVLEKLKEEDAQRIHVFSSFFYKRLTQREKGSVPDRSNNLPIHKRKHNRVKTWTRHVDLFDKDFIFVPINESAHWYLAVICFPGADPPPEELPEHCRPLSPDTDVLDPAAAAGRSPPRDPPPQEAFPERHALAPAPGHPEPHYTNELQQIGVRYADEDGALTSDEQSSSQDEGSDDGGAPPEDASRSAPNRDASRAFEAHRGKRSCILIMDSLRGPARSTVVKTLREYLEVEWEVRKGSRRTFGKDVMKGSSPRVPQQDNFSDCGIYVLQYVESFFENPIVNFQLPINLSEWFPQQRMRSKRQEISGLILRIQAQQEADKGRVERPEASSEEADVEETCGSVAVRAKPPLTP